jgi:hypothetical protein
MLAWQQGGGLHHIFSQLGFSRYKEVHEVVHSCCICAAVYNLSCAGDHIRPLLGVVIHWQNNSLIGTTTMRSLLFLVASLALADSSLGARIKYNTGAKRCGKNDSMWALHGVQDP